MFFTTLALPLALLPMVYAHGVILDITGANGVSTMGFGVAAATPRTGTSEQPFQLDTPVLKNLKDDPCGATLQSGSINIAKSLTTALTQGGGSLPSLSANGSITMTIHQVNADGGGPYSAMVNLDATGKTWVAATVTQQVPGANGIVRGGPVDSQFTVQLDDPAACTGGTTKDTCLIRINNGGEGQTQSLANGAGPFGGCVAVINAGAAAASTVTATTAATTTAAATGGRRNRNKNAAAATLNRRSSIAYLLSKRLALDAEIEMKRRELNVRQLLTVDLIDEIKTATGSAIDIPIDALAGQIDSSALGGNSTTAAKARITKQEAVDIKKAVQGAIEAALSVLSAGAVDTAGFAVSAPLGGDKIDEANRAAEAALASGETTSVNLGNAGVGEPQTAVVNSLLGAVSDVRTLTLTTLGAQATATAAAVTTKKGKNAKATAVAGAAAGVDAAATATGVADAAAATATTVKGSKKAAKNTDARKRMMLSRVWREDA